MHAPCFLTFTQIIAIAEILLLCRCSRCQLWFDHELDRFQDLIELGTDLDWGSSKTHGHGHHITSQCSASYGRTIAQHPAAAHPISHSISSHPIASHHISPIPSHLITCTHMYFHRIGERRYELSQIVACLCTDRHIVVTDASVIEEGDDHTTESLQHMEKV